MRFLEEANRSLSEANVRLARERLGVHDSAAAALVAELQAHREAAQANYDAMLQAKATLRAPRYRAVDKLRDLLFEIPGLSALLRLRSRLIRGRSDSALSKRALPRSPREVREERLLKNHAVRAGGGQPHEDVRLFAARGVRVAKAASSERRPANERHRGARVQLGERNAVAPGWSVGRRAAGARERRDPGEPRVHG